MDRGWWWRFWLVVGVTLFTLWFLVPSYYSFFVLPKEQRNNVKVLEERLPGWAPPAKYRLNLGLDLQGGIHMVMRVDTKTALQKRVERRAIQISNYVRDRKLGEVEAVANPERLELTVTAADPATIDAIAKDVITAFGDFNEQSREGGKVVLSLKESQVNRFKDESVDMAIHVIRRRIDRWGVAEADIRKQGNDSIQISLPGYQDPEKAKELIGRTAQLEFRMVDEADSSLRNAFTQAPPPATAGITLSSEGFGQLEAKDREALLEYVKGKVPENRAVLLECVPSAVKKDECDKYQTWVVDRAASITGESLASADVSLSQQTQDPEVNIQFDAQGARDFEMLTERNVGRYMAIVLDDNVHSAPRINEKIPGGNARITLGRGSAKSRDELISDAQTLALVLKAGALPAPVTTGEIRQVGAMLGPELIRKGSLAAVVGLVLVVLFMAIYYRKSGLIADVALILNGALILAALGMLNATLTLPGIAGFVLTLGIAVDANVLINERIREELGHGKTPRAAVDQGYDRAFWTIFDAHVTTLIAGVILFITGTGPVRGFATALIVGLIASMFTSIVVTRVIVTYFVHGRNAKTISV